MKKKNYKNINDKSGGDMKKNRKSTIVGVLALCFSILFLFSCTRNNTDSENDNTITLAQLIDASRIFDHLESFQQIANENSGNRVAGSSGYDESVRYVRDVLSNTNFVLTEQEFTCRYFEEITVPVVEITAPTPKTYEWWNEFRTVTYSGSGDVTGEIVFIDPVMPPGTEINTSTSGCEIEDFTGVDLTGKIAVIQRGSCIHQEKAENAANSGASAVIIYNEGTEGRTDVYSTRLARMEDVSIPVLVVSHEIGAELYNLVNSGQSVTVHVNVNARDEWTPIANVIAETPAGRSDQVIVVGAHLDSVREGPGINDNCSGSATILELARLMSEQGYNPVNKIVFAWWGAEEQGLVGSYHYISDLYENHPAQYQNISMYINLDMTASPNYIRTVTDSDGSDIQHAFEYIPGGSSELEATFADYFNSRNLPFVQTSLSASSDQYCFAAYGIPSSMLYAGGGSQKTQELYDLFGGTIGEPLDACWHQPCDTTDNINMEILLQNAQALAHVTQYYGDRTGVLFESTRAAARTAEVVPRIPRWAEKPDLNHKDRLSRIDQ
jgi:Zn-dependent M28 family amino/carboxypeptidase